MYQLQHCEFLQMKFHVQTLYQNLDIFQKSHRLKISISNPFRKAPLSIFCHCETPE